MKRLEMHNADVVDAPRVCHACQQPDPDARYSDGEWYHDDCAPEGVV